MTNPVSKTKLIVAFLDCETLDKRAASFLVLSQNRVQRVFTFSTLDLDGFRKRGEIALDPPEYAQRVDHKRYVARAMRAITATKKYVKTKWKDEIDPIDDEAQWLVVTEVPFADEYYMIGDAQSEPLILTLADWERSMAPPSAMEFILRASQTAAVSFLALEAAHFETRACLCDYNFNLSDVRHQVLAGHLCVDCAHELGEKAGEEAVEAMNKLLSSDWLGGLDVSSSVASVLKKVFGYDLYLTKGLAPTRHEQVYNALFAEGPKEFVKLIGLIIVGVVGILFAVLGVRWPGTK